MSNFQGLFDVRDAKESDLNFILATFLRGLYYGDSWFSFIPKSVFMSNYKRVAENLLKSPRTTVKVACLKEDQDVILGYSILSSDFSAVDWVYVKAAWRRKGIATQLLPKYPSVFTHLSTLGKSLMPKYPSTIFDPFKINR